MHLKKSIVLIALVAATAAPTAGARFLPDPGDSGNALQPVPIVHPVVHPKKPLPKLCVRQLQVRANCLAFGF
jgi:hypothetical protein